MAKAISRVISQAPSTYGNDACDNFIHAVGSIHNFAQVLEVLDIESTNGCDFTVYLLITLTTLETDFEGAPISGISGSLRDCASYPDSLDTDRY